MQIGLLGINYKSSEIDAREWVSKACLKRFSSESEITEKFHCIVLSTCNRTEIYFSCENLAEGHSELLNVLREEVPIAFEHKLYAYFGIDCFLHLAKVTAGLDSAIVAESEIQRQVKNSYEQVLLHYPLPSCMHYMFQKCLKLGKEIRSTLPLAENQVTIAKILFQISEYLLNDLSGLPILFIGNSEINRKVMTYFKRKKIDNITLCTRSPFAAREMAEKESLNLLAWEKLQEWQKFSIVICGSNASHIIKSVGDDLHTRLIFDLSMPRNVDPRLSRHPSLTLLNMETLSDLIEKKQKKNRIEINHAEMIISERVQYYVHTFREKETRAVLLCV